MPKQAPAEADREKLTMTCMKRKMRKRMGGAHRRGERAGKER
jgi:hypothetical protein